MRSRRARRVRSKCKPVASANRAVLTLDSTSKPAFQTLLFLHLQTDDYASAIALLDNPPASSSLEFERAYCLYRLHREQEALDILTGINSSGRKQLHLEAQIVSLSICVLVRVLTVSGIEWATTTKLKKSTMSS